MPHPNQGKVGMMINSVDPFWQYRQNQSIQKNQSWINSAIRPKMSSDLVTLKARTTPPVIADAPNPFNQSPLLSQLALMNEYGEALFDISQVGFGLLKLPGLVQPALKAAYFISILCACGQAAFDGSNTYYKSLLSGQSTEAAQRNAQLNALGSGIYQMATGYYGWAEMIKHITNPVARKVAQSLPHKVKQFGRRYTGPKASFAELLLTTGINLCAVPILDKLIDPRAQAAFQRFWQQLIHRPEV
jgi:hypothetical protein